MMRNKDRFYWSDRLYLARVKDELIPVDQKPSEIIYQCNNCSALIRFKVSDADRKTGQWLRLKPYEHYQLMKIRTISEATDKDLEFVETYKNPARELFQCKHCASYWWKDHDGWERVDDETIDTV